MKQTKLTQGTKRSILEALGSVESIINGMLQGKIEPDDAFIVLAKRDMKKIRNQLNYFIYIKE